MSYSTKQFAKYLKVHECTLYSWIKKGLIPPSSHESRPIGQKGIPTKLWHDDVVESFCGDEIRELVQNNTRKKDKKHESKEKIDFFHLVLKSSANLTH